MRRRDLVVALVTAAACTVVLGGVAWAAIPGPDGLIQGCYDNGGNVKVVAALPCPRGYTPFSWNAQGPQGIQGPQGTQGPQGIPGTNGVDGSDGEDGEDGTGPTVAQLATGDATCPAGGAAITDAAGSTAYVCSGQNGEDGADGEPFAGTFTSPNGQYSISVTDAGITLARAGGSVIQLSGNDILAQSAGAYSTVAGSSLSLASGSGFDVTSGGDMTASIAGNLEATIASNLQATIGSNLVTSIGRDAIATIARDLAVQISRDATVGVAADFMVHGGIVNVNGGTTCPAAARRGDSVNLTTGSILTGSATVCIG